MNSEFRTRVHIANTPINGVQCCLRCNTVLIDARYTMSTDGQEPRYWRTGGFVGVAERADSVSVSPICSAQMDRDAKEADEIACNAEVRSV